MLEVIRHDYVRTARAKGLAERGVVYRHALSMGTALVQAVSYRDYPTVQAMVFVMALVFLTINLLVDVLYAWLDPRIRYA
jgi:peptide/nickel transport system permease protein